MNILYFFGYTTLTTTKQTIENTAAGTKAGVDVIAETSISAIDKIQDYEPNSTSTYKPQGHYAKTNLPVQQQIQQSGSNVEQWQQDSLLKALDNAKQQANVQPDDSRSSIQTTGKSGWCYIGEEQGTRTCAELGVNDVCMSGDVFPNQAICMNPNLRT